MQVRTNLEGEHKGLKFTLYNGYLNVLGAKLTENDVKHIVEIVTLLRAQGYQLLERERRIKRMPSPFEIWNGAEPEYYDDEEMK